MSKVTSVNSSNSRILMMTVAAVALAIALPLLVKVATSHAFADEIPGPSLIAQLTGGPIAGQTPHGTAAFFPGGSNTTPHLYVEIGNVNLPAMTHLNVFQNENNIGTIILNSQHGGFLSLPRMMGDPPPTGNAGDVFSVTPGTVPGGNTEVLHGTFAEAPTPSPFPTHSPFPSPTRSPFMTPSPHPSHSPFPSPSPFPTHSPFPTPSPHPTHSPFPTPTGTPVPPTHFYAPLTGEPIGGIMPRGIGVYEAFNGEIIAVLNVYVSMVNLPEGTQLDVAVAGNNVGTITLHMHQGALHLTSNVPSVMEGDALTVSNGNAAVLAGTFSSTPPVPPTPTPRMTPTPRGTPSPHPSPLPPHAFGANLNGEQEVPPVMTEGRGHGYVLLSPDETEIRVFVGFGHLSGPATGVTINGPAEPGATGNVIFTLTMPTNPPNTLPFQNFPVTDEQVTQLRANMWYFNVTTDANPDGEIRGQIHSVNHRDDFDGDGVSEVSLMRPADGTGDLSNTWYILNSADSSVTSTPVGRPGDINVQGDYDGDGTADVAMFTPASGTWQIRLSATGQTMNYQFGTNGDVPLVGDYDGDEISDLVVFRPATGNWYIRRSLDGEMRAIHWGQNGDRPVTGDFDGDGKNDLAVFRPSVGNWYIYRTSDGGTTAMHWGLSGDRPVAGDFDGDGISDVAVFRPSEGNWYVSRSSDAGFTALHFGTNGDVPVPCEFDGDGTTDIAVFRPSDGNWYILRSSDGTMQSLHFGLSTDRPLTTAYAP